MSEATAALPAMAATPARKPWYKILYIQVLVAIVLGVLVGWLFPDLAKNDWIKALGDGFVKLIRMAIAPIIFCTVVSGIAHISDVKKVGRVAVKALVYFEIVSTFALARPSGREPAAPGRGIFRPIQRRGGRKLCQASRRNEVGRFPPAYHSGQRGRRLRGRRYPAGAVVFGAVRLRTDGIGRTRQHASVADRRSGSYRIRHHFHYRQSGADRRVRRDGLYHRPLWAHGIG